MSGLILDKVAYVSRLQKLSGDSDKEQYSIDDSLREVPINVQPSSNEDTILQDGRFVQTWIGFATESGIRSGDKITISGVSGDERVYIVRGVQDWAGLEAPHLELTLTEFMEGEFR